MNTGPGSRDTELISRLRLLEATARWPIVSEIPGAAHKTGVMTEEPQTTPNVGCLTNRLCRNPAPLLRAILQIAGKNEDWARQCSAPSAIFC